MINISLIFICVLAGIIIARLNILPKNSFKAVNAWLLYVALPALALRFVPDIKWDFTAITPGISPPIIWIGAFLFVNIYTKFVKLDKETKTALIITSGICNSAFLGFPLIAAYFGEENIRNAIVYDQVTFLMFSTVVVPFVLKTYSNQKISFRFIIKKIFLFPSFIATIFALVVSPFFDYSEFNPLLDKILATLSPLALFSIGLQIQFNQWKVEIKNIIAGLSYKLFIAPLIILGLIILVNENSIVANITLLEASMPAHITGSLLASQYNLNARLCNLMVGIGIIVSFVTSAFWYFVGITAI